MGIGTRDGDDGTIRFRLPEVVVEQSRFTGSEFTKEPNGLHSVRGFFVLTDEPRPLVFALHEYQWQLDLAGANGRIACGRKSLAAIQTESTCGYEQATGGACGRCRGMR